MIVADQRKLIDFNWYLLQLYQNMVFFKKKLEKMCIKYEKSVLALE